MLDKPTTHQERIRKQSHLAGYGPPTGKEQSEPPESGEGACAAFGFLRGIRERADAIEFRFRSGNSVWFPYSWLGNWKFNPSEGLLLKFSGDVVYLVLIRGSALDKPLGDGSIDLIRAGLQRHRVIWVKEMSEEETRQVGDAAPTIDSITITEFKSHAELKEWLEKMAGGFLH